MSKSPKEPKQPDFSAFVAAAKAAVAEMKVNRRVPFTPAVAEFVAQVEAFDAAQA